MEFTKEKTNIAKGAAIFLMFSNHLYSFPDRILNGNYYIPLIPSFNIEQHVGNFGSVCVSMFLFLSGYGMFLGYSNSNQTPLKYSLRKLKEFYLTYWTYFLIFVPIGLIFFKQVTFWNSDEIRYSPEMIDLLAGLLGWSATYNGEWWFVRMFILILFLLFPFYISLTKRSPAVLISISSSLFLISWISRVDYTGPYGFMFWQISFAVGMVCAKSRFFSSRFARHFDNSRGAWFLLSVLFFFIIRMRFGAKIDFLFVAILIYATIRIVNMFRLAKIFAHIGSYAFPMWLVHSFFCYYYFQDFIYFPKWSPLVFALLTLSSLITAYSIEYLRAHVAKLNLFSIQINQK